MKTPIRPLLPAGAFVLAITLLDAYTAVVVRRRFDVGSVLISTLLLGGVMSALLSLSWLAHERQVVVRLVGLVPLILLAAASATAAFLSFAAWMTGVVLSREALLMLFGNGGRSALHLLQSAPWMAGIALAAAALLIWLNVFVFRRTGAALSGLSTRTRLRYSAFAVATAVLSALALDQQRPEPAVAMLDARPERAPELPTMTPGECSCVPIESPPAAEPPANPHPIILILAESLRYDLLAQNPTAVPFLSKLAAEGVLFEKAYGTSSHSDFTDLAFWYSRYPLRHIPRRGYPPDAPWRGLSAFEYFKRHHYSTAYFSSQNEKWGDMINWLKRPELDLFFHSEDFRGTTWENPDDVNGLIRLIKSGLATAGKVEDSNTLAHAGDWIASRRQEPFIVGLNLQNTHFSYVIPPGGAEPFQPSDLGFRRVYYSWPKERATEARNRYLNAIYNVDRLLSQFADRLAKIGVWDDALVLVLGDNGEAFYEHGFGNHSGPMYEEVARTLAIAKFPKGDPRNGKPYRQPVSHIDFVPLAVSVGGLPAWPGFQGIVPGRARPGRPIFMHVDAIAKEDGVLVWPWKLLVRSHPDRALELYRLDADPGERSNLAGRERGQVEALSALLTHWRACQLSYYGDEAWYERVHPPQYD